ncbi:MAG: substrate-binding domain-containing protein [Nitrospiraceae bacterium]|nr:substrate-binding domain-containing protein [Nitrospiraceae bacterium]
MKKITVVLAVAAAFLLTWSIAGSADEIKVGAGAAPVSNVLEPVKEHFEKASGTKLVIIASGPKIALSDLEKGAVDAAAAGLSFDDWMALMKKDGTEVKDPSSLHQFTIGKDKIIIIVHKDNPVAKLSKEQLKGIFTGRITNWQEVGGKNMPIIVVWGKLIPGTNSMFEEHMLDGEKVATEVLDATTATDVRQNVAANPEAIGIGPMTIVDETVKSPETPEVSRPIILVTKGSPSPSVQKLINFIQGEGQKYIK